MLELALGFKVLISFFVPELLEFTVNNKSCRLHGQSVCPVPAAQSTATLGRLSLAESDLSLHSSPEILHRDFHTVSAWFGECRAERGSGSGP